MVVNRNEGGKGKKEKRSEIGKREARHQMARTKTFRNVREFGGMSRRGNLNVDARPGI